jgi:hypothetical protein
MFKNKFYKKVMITQFILFLVINIMFIFLDIEQKWNKELSQYLWVIFNSIIFLFPFEFVYSKDFKNIDWSK